MPSHHGSIETYRLIITRRNATETLLLSDCTDWTLPRVEIRNQQRIPEQLTEGVRNRWGFETYCLFIPSSRASCRDGEATCAVMECVKQNDKAPAGTYWMPVNVADECGEAEDASAIRCAFAELKLYASGEKSGAFAKPGWMRELFRWAHEQTAPLGLRLTGEFRQLNASPTFSLVRLETDAAALWFKATGEPNAHELPVTLLLASLFPDHVPRALGVHALWNGWLTAEVPGTPLDETTDCSAWERAAGGLAELQVESTGRSAELLDAHCKDMRFAEVEKHIDPFLSRMGEFMRVQEKNSPAPLTSGELASLGEALKKSFSLLRSFGFPDTLGHLDCNPGNIFVSPERCVFLDWAEACVTNPVITFEYLHRHLERNGVEGPAADARITAAYVRPWVSFFSPEDLQRAIVAVPPVAVFVYAIAGDTWRSLDPASNPKLAGFFRSMTRRMYRGAVLAAERSERCLS